MALTYVQHRKISLRKDPNFNEAWVHDRIAEDPTILGLGDVRVLDRERSLPGGGRLDMLLFDDDNSRRFEVEIMLGATDPSHIIRAIEYWDLQRRQYPGYDHVAVLVAEDITARFLNVMGLLAGSIPLIAIQLDALQVNDNIVLNFVRVLDQTELRIDDSDDDDGDGGTVDRAYWDSKAGPDLMRVCDAVLSTINETAEVDKQFNYMRGYIGLRSGGLVRNFIGMAPKPMKNIVHISFQNSQAGEWMERLEEADIVVRSRHPRRLRLSLSPQTFEANRDLIAELIAETVQGFES
jgi:hypothetical protein